MESNIVRGNIDKRTFGPIERKELGFYVYALRDPRDRKIFYIGQGHNDRVFDHLKEADNYLNKGLIRPNSKVMRILDIWSSNEDVEWIIISSGHEGSDPEVLNAIESAVIDAISECQNGPALNAVSGPHSTYLSKEDLAKIGADPVNPTRPYQTLFVFAIQGALANGETVYDATRKAWFVTDYYRHRENAVAVGLKDGYSLGSYLIDKWILFNDRFGFEGHEYPEMMNKNWQRVISDARGFWQRGGYRVVAFDGNGSFKFHRGNPDKEWRKIDE